MYNCDKKFVENVPRSVLLSNWFYLRLDDYNNYNKARAEAFEKLDKLGYEQIPTASLWAGAVDNPYSLMMHGKTKMTDELVKGYMIIPWVYEINQDTVYSMKNNIHTFYLARKEVYPESLV